MSPLPTIRQESINGTGTAAKVSHPSLLTVANLDYAHLYESRHSSIELQEANQREARSFRRVSLHNVCGGYNSIDRMGWPLH